MNKSFSKGDRVVVRKDAGFHRGAKGVIQLVEPNGTCHVLRDGASSAVFYDPSELDHEEAHRDGCNLGMVVDTRRLARYIKATQNDAEMAIILTPTGPARDVLTEVNTHLMLALKSLEDFDTRCVHEHYHGPTK